MADDNKSMVFDDILPQEVPVRIGKKDYVLREPMGDVAAKYRNAVTNCTKMEDGNVVGLRGFGDIQPYLVSLCLFEVLADGTVKNVSVALADVRGWPNRIISDLFDRAEAMGGLEPKQDEAALAKQIAKLQRKLDKLRGENGQQTQEEEAGNSQS